MNKTRISVAALALLLSIVAAAPAAGRSTYSPRGVYGTCLHKAWLTYANKTEAALRRDGGETKRTRALERVYWRDYRRKELRCSRMPSKQLHRRVKREKIG